MSAPVYLKIADLVPHPLPIYSPEETSPKTLLLHTWGSERANRGKIGTLLQSSFDSQQLTALRPERNGFIGTVLTAYGQHHHLIIRPDDVWLAILTQFNFYVNCNAELLRSKFVAHEGKKTLCVKTIDFASLAKDMTEEIHENVVDKELKDWILPKFSTTTDNDIIVCAAAMMATLKAYFVYEGGITCGIPSITLEGTQKDWQNIFYRLDKLEEFGTEPRFWASLLRPILRKFVHAFDGEADIAFWKTMVNRDDICGATLISGWITAFGIWSDKGKWTGPALSTLASLKDVDDYPSFATVTEWPQFSLSLDRMPVGFFDLDLKLIDDLEEYDCTVVAGHVAILAEGAAHDTIRPQSGWFVFTKMANQRTIEMQAKLKLQEEKRKCKSDRKAKKNIGKGNTGELNEDLTHASGCFGLNSMLASILAVFRRR